MALCQALAPEDVRMAEQLEAAEQARGWGRSFGIGDVEQEMEKVVALAVRPRDTGP